MKHAYQSEQLLHVGAEIRTTRDDAGGDCLRDLRAPLPLRDALCACLAPAPDEQGTMLKLRPSRLIAQLIGKAAIELRQVWSRVFRSGARRRFQRIAGWSPRMITRQAAP